jgi:DNA-binding beta-propeller fold protein YncE
MRKVHKLLLVFMLTLVSVVGLTSVSSSSATTYTYARNRKGFFVITQDAYLPDRTVLDLGMSDPQDVVINELDQLWIADTGNKRIVLYDPFTDTVLQEITHPDFNSPKGIFLTEDNFIYVADSGASTIFKFSTDGSLVDSFGRPTSASYGEQPFDPKKIAVDNQGSMYIVAEGIFDGIVQMSETGEFLGYFTRNIVQLSPQQQLEKLLFTDEQREQLGDINPISFSNVYVDQKGIKYTTSFGLDISNLKKHNTDGSNSIDTDYGVDLELVDVYTDQFGIMYAASQTGQIYLFTSDGSFIFGFGTQEANEDVSGFYSDLSSIAVDSQGTIWTLDTDKAFLQSFAATEYSTTIYEALTLYNAGKYEEAVVKWEQVLQLNQLSVLAHNEIGRNLFSQGYYEESLIHFELSGNRFLYSESYWEVRNIDLQQNLPFIILGFFLVGVAYLVVKYTNRRYEYLNKPKAAIKKFTDIKVVNDVLYGFNLFRHPLDSFYYIKKGRKGSYLGGSILFLTFFVSYMLFTTSKGFIYQYVEAADLDLNAIVIGFFAIFILFVLSNYLVTSINDGEGSIGEIFLGVTYSLVPVTLAFFAITYLSYYMTFNEVIILDGLYFGGIGLTGLFIFLAVQELHNYTIRETIKSFAMTLLFMMIVGVLLAFVQIMGDQLIQFFIGLFREAFFIATGVLLVLAGIAWLISFIVKKVEEVRGNEAA